MITIVSVFRVESPEKGETLRKALEEHVRRYLVPAPSFVSAEVLLGEGYSRLALVEKWSSREAQLARLEDERFQQSLAELSREALSVDPMLFPSSLFLAHRESRPSP